MDAARRQIVVVNAAHVFTHYGLLILATAVLAMVLQEDAGFGAAFFTAGFLAFAGLAGFFAGMCDSICRSRTGARL